MKSAMIVTLGVVVLSLLSIRAQVPTQESVIPTAASSDSKPQIKSAKPLKAAPHNLGSPSSASRFMIKITDQGRDQIKGKQFNLTPAKVGSGDRTLTYYAASNSNDIAVLAQTLGITHPSSVNIKNIAYYLDIGLALLEFSDDVPVSQVQGFSPIVEHVEPDHKIFATDAGIDTECACCNPALPNDGLFTERQWNLHSEENPVADINAMPGWKLLNSCTRKQRTVVAILDSGVDINHPEISDNLWVNDAEADGNTNSDDDGNGFVDDVHGIDAIKYVPWIPWSVEDVTDNNGHGTLVSGVAGAVANNHYGISGVDQQPQLMIIKVLEEDNGQATGYIWDLIQGLFYAWVMDADVINASLVHGYSFWAEWIIRFLHRDTVIVAAAGNENNLLAAYPLFPASYPLSNIIAVGASTDLGEKAYFSNYDDREVEVFAPGYEVLSTVPGNDFMYFSGTSAAAPHVAGIASSILSIQPDLKAAAVNAIITATAKMNENLKPYVVGGIADLFAALKVAKHDKKIKSCCD